MMSEKVPQINEMNLYPMYMHLFSEDARKAMKREVKELFLQYNESTGVNIKPYDPYPDNGPKDPVLTNYIHGEVKKDPKRQLYRTLCKLGIGMETIRKGAAAKFFGVTIEDAKDMTRAAEIIAETINRMAEQDLLKGAFSRLSGVQMHKAWNDLRPGKIAVYAVVHIADDYFKKEYKAKDIYNIEFYEGGMPKDLEDIDVIREE